VFWNTRRNKLPETLDTQSEIYVPGLETFALDGSGESRFMYTVEAGEMIKYELKEEGPTLTLHSAEPVLKIFKFYILGSCDDL
jgi:hypothetical protein